MEWPPEFYAQLAGSACPMCEQGRPDETPHGVQPTELMPEEASAYGSEVLHVARALQAALEPVKLNYDVLGNSSPHLHTHLVPRYADDPRPGWPFPFPDPDPPPMAEDRLRADVEALRRATR